MIFRIDAGSMTAVAVIVSSQYSRPSCSEDHVAATYAITECYLTVGICSCNGHNPGRRATCHGHSYIDLLIDCRRIRTIACDRRNSWSRWWRNRENNLPMYKDIPIEICVSWN